MDVIQVLTEKDYPTARKYWNKLKERILAEAGQPGAEARKEKKLLTTKYTNYGNKSTASQSYQPSHASA